MVLVEIQIGFFSLLCILTVSLLVKSFPLTSFNLFMEVCPQVTHYSHIFFGSFTFFCLWLLLSSAAWVCWRGGHHSPKTSPECQAHESTARKAFLDAMYSVISKETKEIVAQSTFNAVLVDESTDVSNVTQMVVHLRCVSSGQFTVRFGGIAPLAKIGCQLHLGCSRKEWRGRFLLVFNFVPWD